VENHTRNLSPNTVAFSCLEDSVAVLILDVIAALVSVLRWRQPSQSLLIAILGRLAEFDSFELSHAEFSAALWPSSKESAREDKFSKWLTKIKEDMALSACLPVEIGKPRRERREDGSFKSLPTLYRRGVFWNLFRAVQDEALKCDLFALEKDKRRSRVRAIVKQWLLRSGATPIERAKKADEIKPAKPTLPCSCACISCQTCAAKALIPSSLPSSEPVLSVQIEEEKKKIRLIEDELVAIGQRRLNRGDKLSIVDNKINAVSVAARMRIKAAVNRSDGHDDYANEAGARARGRASQEIAVAELRAMKREAEEMGELKHAAKLAEFASVLENWKLFQSRKGVTLNGGQPK
jgi:hypothetical protein